VRPALIGPLATAALVVVLAGAAPAAAAPADDLDRARAAFRAGDCAAAAPTLAILLYPTPQLATPSDLAEAHLLYGACLVGAGDSAAAAREFEEALFVETSLTLDPTLFSGEAIRVFDQTRAAVEARARQEAEARALAEERERLRKYREGLIFYEVRPYYLNFVPGGIGQFQRGSIGKGTFFAVTQLATAATSAGIWLYLVQTYGYGGTVPREDAAFARRLQQIEIGTGVAFLGLVAWGIVDSLIHYKPQVQVRGDDSLLVPPPPKPSSERPAMALAPALWADGGGLTLRVEY
jgi:hypothetical protein